MLKYNNVELNISSSNYKKYYKKYGPYKKGDTMKIDVEDLSVNSTAKVIAICKFCKKEKELKYQTYKIQFDKGGYYCCSSCGKIKQKETMKKNGSSYFLENQEKYKEKMILEYGVNNPSKIEDVKKNRSKRLKDNEYQKKLVLGVKNKYNVENVSKLDEIKEKKRQTCLENYGVENPMQNEEIFIKSQKSGKKINNHAGTGLYYRGTYEKDFLDFCHKNNIPVSQGNAIKYKKKQ